jgi:hypothetical protein
MLHFGGVGGAKGHSGNFRKECDILRKKLLDT